MQDRGGAKSFQVHLGIVGAAGKKMSQEIIAEHILDTAYYHELQLFGFGSFMFLRAKKYLR